MSIRTIISAEPAVKSIDHDTFTLVQEKVNGTAIVNHLQGMITVSGELGDDFDTWLGEVGLKVSSCTQEEED